jgi:hypothetical protein
MAPSGVQCRASMGKETLRSGACVEHMSCKSHVHIFTVCLCCGLIYYQGMEHVFTV